MTENTSNERTFLLCAAYLAGVLAGAWLGLAAATVTGMAVSEPPRFPGEDAVAAVAAALILFGVYISVRRTSGRLAALDSLFIAAISAMNLLLYAYLLAPQGVECAVPVQPIEGPTTHTQPLLVAAQQSPSTCRVTGPAFVGPKLVAAMTPSILVAALMLLAAIRQSAAPRLLGFAAGSLFVVTGLVFSLIRAVG